MDSPRVLHVIKSDPVMSIRALTAGSLAFLGGFIIMVLEIIGARFLANDFGSSFYVWISQIGMIMVALALGYYLGGALGDRLGRLGWLAAGLLPSGVFVLLIPHFAANVMDAIVMRHPLDQPIPPLWQKLDPALGSAILFFLPCLVLASLGPYLIRLASSDLAHIGRISGMIFATSTVGSIAGVIVSGYVLLDLFPVSQIFRMTGILTIGLGLVCLFLDGKMRWNGQP